MWALLVRKGLYLLIFLPETVFVQWVSPVLCMHSSAKGTGAPL